MSDAASEALAEALDTYQRAGRGEADYKTACEQLKSVADSAEHAIHIRARAAYLSAEAFAQHNWKGILTQQRLAAEAIARFQDVADRFGGIGMQSASLRAHSLRRQLDAHRKAAQAEDVVADDTNSADEQAPKRLPQPTSSTIESERVARDQADSQEFTEQTTDVDDTSVRQVMFTHAPDGASDEIFYLNYYRPYRIGGVLNPDCDALSRKLMDLKDRQVGAIDHFCRATEDILGHGFPITTVPPSQVSEIDSGIATLCKRLATNNRIDATSCLVRTRSVPSAARSGGDRAAEERASTIAVRNPEIVRGQHILLLDDVTTTGHMLRVCEQRLVQAGAASVKKAALLQTWHQPTVNWDSVSCVLFDMDMTLVDTSCIAPLRNARKWDEAGARVADTVAYPGVQALLRQLRDRNVQIAVVSSSPTHLCEHILSHHALPHDLLRGYSSPAKPSPAPYLTALRQLGTAATQDVVAVGDRPQDVQAAVNAGIRSVGAMWGCEDRPSLRASLPNAICDSVKDLAELLSRATPSHDDIPF